MMNVCIRSEKRNSRFLLSGLVAGVLAVSLGACGASPEERYERARAAYKAHDFNAARVDLAAVAMERPQDKATLELLARTHLALGDGEGALSALDRLASLKQLPLDARVLRGEAEVLRGQPDAALLQVQGLTSAPALRVRALALIAKNDASGALAAFEAGERADGERAPLLADYAHMRLAQGDRAEARRLADLAASAKPRPLSSYLASADVEAEDYRLGKALAGFEAALVAYPQSKAAMLGKIRMLDRLGRIAEARPLIEAGLADNGKDPEYLFLAARLDALEGKWQAVRDRLQSNEDMLKEAPDANALYARALDELGQGESARVRLTSQLLQRPQDRRTRILLGQLQLKQGDPRGAQATLEPLAVLPDATAQELGLLAQAARAGGDARANAFAAQSREAMARDLVGRLATADRALREKDWGGAIKGYEDILARTDGKNALVLNNLAFAYDGIGNAGKALVFAERALRLAPDNASVMDTAGWLLYRSGKDRTRALGLLREAARRAPQNATIAAHLAKAEQG